MSKLQEGQEIEGFKIVEQIGNDNSYLVLDGNKNYFIVKELGGFALPPKKVAEILKSIKHPGLQEFYGTFIYDKSVYIVTERFEGETLEEKIKSLNEPFDEETVVKWAIQLSEILFYFHTYAPEPLVYDGIKPSNIIISDSGNASFDVFNIGKLVCSKLVDKSRSKDVEVNITKGDIYALGVLLHNLLTGYEQLSSAPLPSIRSLKPSVNKALEEIIENAVSPSLEKRYDNVYIFRKKLLEYYKKEYGNFEYSYNEEDFNILSDIDFLNTKPFLVAPPRKLSLLMALQVIMGLPVSLLMVLVGILWSIAFLWSWGNLYEDKIFKGPLDYGEGTVISVSDEAIGHGMFTHTVNYEFYLKEDNKRYVRTSYVNNYTNVIYNKGDNVAVEFLKGNPLLSRIQGMRMHYPDYAFNFTNISFFVLLFSMVISVMRFNRIYLIKYGKSGTGIFKEKKTEGNQIKLFFTFIAENGNIYRDFITGDPFIPLNCRVGDKFSFLYSPRNMKNIDLPHGIPLKIKDGVFYPDMRPIGIIPLLTLFYPLFLMLLYILYINY